MKLRKKQNPGAATYKPILLILSLYITLIRRIDSVYQSLMFLRFMQAMRHFMAGFFLVFSFFKMLNLKGFARSYT